MIIGYSPPTSFKRKRLLSFFLLFNIFNIVFLYIIFYSQNELAKLIFFYCLTKKYCFFGQYFLLIFLLKEIEGVFIVVYNFLKRMID